MSTPEDDSPLTAQELRELEVYEKIIQFHNQVFSGQHPTIKLTTEQLTRNGGPPALIGVSAEIDNPAEIDIGRRSIANPPAQPQRNRESSTNDMVIPDRSASNSQENSREDEEFGHDQEVAKFENGQTSNKNLNSSEEVVTFGHSQSSKNNPNHSQEAVTNGHHQPSSTNPNPLREVVVFGSGVPLFNVNDPNSPRALATIGLAPTLTDVFKSIHPSYTALSQSAATAEEPAMETNMVSRLNFNRDYYHELGIPHPATKDQIRNAIRDYAPSAKQQEAHEILSDDFARYLYDDSRTAMFTVAARTDAEKKQKAKEAQESARDSSKAVALDIDHYKALGVQPGGNTTVDSITRAYRCKEAMHTSDKAVVREAYRVLSNYHLRKEYDRSRGIPLVYLPSRGKRTGRSRYRR